MTKLAVIYYSATGHGTTMAPRVAAAAEAAAPRCASATIAETRDPESFAQNPAWTANYEATKDLPAATGDDIVWADAVIFGSPTRFGSAASQLRAFLDSLGGLWSKGKLADKVYAAFTSVTNRARRPGDHPAHPVHHADALRRHHRPAGIHRCLEVRRRQPLRREPHRRTGEQERTRGRDQCGARPPGTPGGRASPESSAHSAERTVVCAEIAVRAVISRRSRPWRRSQRRRPLHGAEIATRAVCFALITTQMSISGDEHREIYVSAVARRRHILDVALAPRSP